MLGAIIGDIAGSKYEFNNVRTEDFELMGPGCDYTDVTHNHQFGLFAAENVEKVFGWLPEYRAFSNKFDESPMNAVPVAVSCFLASDSFEDAVRKSIIVGGDSDTIGAITGALAEAYYGITEEIKSKALGFLPDDIRAVVEQFNKNIK